MKKFIWSIILFVFMACAPYAVAWNETSWGGKRVPYTIQTTAPAVTDDDYPVPFIWINTDADTAYVLLDNSPGAAVWGGIGSSGSGDGDVSTDDIWTAAGELVVGTGAGTAHKLSAGALTTILVGGGAADPVWTTATGSGAPVRAGDPTLKSTTADGSTDALKLTDSGDAEIAAINSDGDMELQGGLTADYLSLTESALPSLPVTDSDDEETPKPVTTNIYSNLTTTTADAQVADQGFQAIGAAVAGTLATYMLWDGSAQSLIVSGILDATGPIFLTEQASANSDVAGKGQIWVKTATPNELWFTDDAGTDVQLGVGGVTVSDDESTDDDHEVVFTTNNADLESDGDFKYNPSTGTVTATVFSGSGASLTGVPAASVALSMEASDTTCWPVFVEGSSSPATISYNNSFTFNSSSATLAATNLSASGNVTGATYGSGAVTDANINTVGRDFSTLAFTNGDTQTEFTAANMRVYRFFSNQGETVEVDIKLGNPSYGVQVIALVEEELVMEIAPPTDEALDLDGTTLDANDCIDSPAVVGSKMVFTRMQNASGTWFWSCDTVRGAWVDTGATD